MTLAANVTVSVGVAEDVVLYPYQPSSEAPPPSLMSTFFVQFAVPVAAIPVMELAEPASVIPTAVNILPVTVVLSATVPVVPVPTVLLTCLLWIIVQPVLESSSSTTMPPQALAETLPQATTVRVKPDASPAVSNPIVGVA